MYIAESTAAGKLIIQAGERDRVTQRIGLLAVMSPFPRTLDGLLGDG
jgi:hypothetical protein